MTVRGELYGLRCALASRSGLRMLAVVWLVMGVPSFALLMASGYNTSLRLGAELAYQRDTATPLSNSVSKHDVTRRSRIIEGRDLVHVIELAGPPRATLGWPGMPTLPEPKTFLASPSAMEDPVVDDLVNGEGSLRELPPSLMASPDEAIVLISVGATHLVGARPVEPGFSVPTGDEFALPSNMFRPTVLVVLMPMFSLVSTASHFLIRHSSERLAIARLVGVTRRAVRLTVAAVLALCAALGSLLGAVVFLVIRAATDEIGNVYSGRLRVSASELLTIVILTVALASLFSLISTRRVVLDPAGAKVGRGSQPWPRSLSVGGIALVALALLGAVVVNVEPTGMSDMMLGVLLLLAIVGGLVGTSLLTVPVAVAIATGLAQRSGSSTFGLQLLNVAGLKIATILAPAAFAAYAAGFTLAIAASLIPSAVESDLEVVVNGRSAAIAREVEGIEGVEVVEVDETVLSVTFDVATDEQQAAYRIRSIDGVVFTEEPIELVAAEALTFRRASRFLSGAALFTVTVGLVTSLLALSALLTDQRGRLELGRTFGMTKWNTIVAGMIVIWLPQAVGTAVPFLVGLGVGNLVRDRTKAGPLLLTPGATIQFALVASAVAAIVGTWFILSRTRPTLPQAH